MWGNPTLFHQANSFEKNIEKILYIEKKYQLTICDQKQCNIP